MSFENHFGGLSGRSAGPVRASRNSFLKNHGRAAGFPLSAMQPNIANSPRTVIADMFRTASRVKCDEHTAHEKP
jgi:hypothetical protein